MARLTHPRLDELLTHIRRQGPMGASRWWLQRRMGFAQPTSVNTLVHRVNRTLGDDTVVSIEDRFVLGSYVLTSDLVHELGEYA
jgi:hypothetical protein